MVLTCMRPVSTKVNTCVMTKLSCCEFPETRFIHVYLFMQKLHAHVVAHHHSAHRIEKEAFCLKWVFLGGNGSHLRTYPGENSFTQV